MYTILIAILLYTKFLLIICFWSFNLFFSCTSPWNFSLCLFLYLKLVDPIEYRCKDDEVRAEATRELLKCIVDHRMAAKSLSTSEREAVSYLRFSFYLLFYLISAK
jgi:hypothetical protein